MVTLQMLLYFIRDLDPVVINSGRKDMVFAGAHRFFGMSSLEKEQHYLQIGSLLEVLQEKDSLKKDMTLLVLDDLTDSEPEEVQKVCYGFPCGLICVHGDFPVAYLHNRMINLFADLANWDKNMHIAALSGDPLQKLIDLSDGFLKHPVIVFDAGFDVLTFSKDVPAEYEYFHATAGRGYTDAQTMNLIKEQNIFKKLDQSREPLVAPAVENPDFSYIYLAFRGDQNILGYACVFSMEKEIHPGYLDLLKIFSENMAFCLKRDFENRIFGQMMHEAFFHNLMSPAGITAEQVSDQIRSLEGLSEKGNFILGVIRFPDQKEIPLPFLARQLAQIMWDVKPYLYENQICLFRILRDNTGKKEMFSEKEKKDLAHVLAHYQWVMGISNPFTHVLELKFAYREAMAAIRFGRMQEKQLYWFDECYLYDLISLMEKEMPADRLRMGLYRKLCDYDRENKTKYTELILTYIKQDCNATHTAEALYLHRNTVTKAVRFVEESWQVSLSDPDVKICMLMGEQVDQYLELQSL